MGSLLSKAIAADGGKGHGSGAVFEVSLDDLLELVEAYINNQVSSRAFADAIDPPTKKNSSGYSHTRGNAMFVQAIRRLYAEGCTLGGGTNPK